MGGTFPGKCGLMWGVDKRRSIGIGEGDLGDVVSSVEPVRSHAGVNVAGPPILDRNAGNQRKKGDELGIIIREGRRVEREHVCHFNVILLLNSITKMRGGVVVLRIMLYPRYQHVNCEHCGEREGRELAD